MPLKRPVAGDPVVVEDFGQPIYDLVVPGVWTDVVFKNGWVNYDATQYVPCQYRKVGDMLQIRGMIKSGSANSVVFTLPVGFRPTRTYSCPVTGPPVGTAYSPSMAIMSYGDCNIYDVVASPATVGLGMITISLT